MPGFQWFGRGILTRTGGVDAQGAVNTSSGITAVGGIVSSSGVNAVGPIASSSGVTARTGLTLGTITQSSSGVTLVSYGIHVFTTAADATYLLARPTVGRDVYFVGTIATGSTHTVVFGSSALGTTDVLLHSSSGGTAARQFAANGGFGLHLIGTSSAAWARVGGLGNIVFSSST